MKKSFKILIVLIIIILAIVPVGYSYYVDYQNQQDRLLFNQTIKNVSNIENQSDTEFDPVRKNPSSMSELKSELQKTNTDIDQEIGILQNLNNKTNNQTHKEYIALEIKRLNGEHDVYSTIINEGLSSSNEVKTKAATVRQTKDDVVTFLAQHFSLKQDLENMNIDEDFRESYDD